MSALLRLYAITKLSYPSSGRGTYEFDTWSIAYETRIKMVEHKSITWVDVAKERYGRSHIHQIPNVQTVNHIILDFESKLFHAVIRSISHRYM